MPEDYVPQMVKDSQMVYIERTLPKRLLSYFKDKIKKDPTLLRKVYNFCCRINKTAI